MSSDVVAQAYAEALFRIAKVEDAVDEVEDELRELGRILHTNYELRGFLDDQGIATEGKKSAVQDLFAGKMSPITLNMLSTVIDRGRQRSLPAVAEAYAALASAHRGKVTAEVTTAVPMPEEMAGKLKDALSTLLKKQVHLKPMVDESVIGGAVVRVGEKIIDGCVRKRLQVLRAAMVKRL